MRGTILTKYFLALLTLQAAGLWSEDGGLESIVDQESDDLIASNQPEMAQAAWALVPTEGPENRFKINFNNVSIIEYIRFISKVTGTNFTFDEGELGFVVTIVSEEPITVKNIMSALVQTLRIHDLNLVEQDKNNLIITRNTNVKEIPTIVSDEKKMKDINSPIITRIFRIKNASLASIVNVIKPMTSTSSSVDVSLETRQLIVTDVLTNVEKIATLINSLDSPHSPYTIEVYKTKQMPPAMLIDLTKQIVGPFAATNPLIYVPQPDNSSIFIVSTPFLIEKSLEVMKEIDVKPKSISASQLTSGSVFLYKIQSKSASELLDAFKQISKELEHGGTQALKMVDALTSAKWIKSANSLMIITDSDTQAKVQDLLKTIDTTSGGHNFFIYRIQKAADEQIEKSLQQLAKSLKKGDADHDLVSAIENMKFVKEMNGIIFTGSDTALKKLTELLPTIDVAVAQFSPSSNFWLYTPQYLSGKELEKALESIEDNLDSAGLSDKALLKTIESMKWVPATNTMIFTGDSASIQHIQDILKLLDVSSVSPSKIYIYQPKNISNEQIEQALDELTEKLDTKNLADRNLAQAIDHTAWMGESQSFLFKADPATIEKLDAFLKDIDSGKKDDAISHSYYLYNLKHVRGDDVIDHLEKIAKSLPTRDLSQRAVINVIDHLSHLKETNSLLLTGTQKAVDEVKALIDQFDRVDATPPSLEKTSFFIYRPTNLTPASLRAALLEVATDLKGAGLIDPILLESIETMRIVEATNSLVFTGSAESLQKTKEILTLVDVPTTETGALGHFAGQTFFIYKPKYLTLDQLLSLLGKLLIDMEKESPTTTRDLAKSIKAAKEIKETNSVLFTGAPSVLQKISELVTQLDLPSGEEIAGEGKYLIYKPQNARGPELIEVMNDFKQNLAQSGVRDPSLFNTISNLRYIPKTGYILVSGDEASIEKVQELLKKFDVASAGGGVTTLTELETSFLVYKLQYHTGADLQTTLKQIATDLLTSDPTINKNLINAINSIQWVKITNSLLATGTPEVLARVRELIQNVDVPLRQVFIDVLIIQTTLTNSQQFGLQWGSKVQYLSHFAGGFGNFPTTNPDTAQTPNDALQQPLINVTGTRFPLATDIPVPVSSATGGFDLGVIGDIILHRGRSFISLASLLNAVQADVDTVVVMNPKLIAQDNMQSTIFVGQNIPFVGSVVNTVGGGTTTATSSNVEYRDIGISLSITPILGTDDIITLDVMNDITSLIQAPSTSLQSISGLSTNHTNLSARIHVPNNHFVALSGMLQDSKSHFKSGIPCLGGLPVLGAFFSENDRQDSKNNLIYFIRPSIIDSVEEFKKITEGQEVMYKTQAVKNFLKEEIDDAIDTVKTPDDE